MSDHAPIFLTLDVPSSSKTCDRVSVSKGVSWNRATDTDILAYKETLRIILALEIAASRCIPHRRKKDLAGRSTLDKLSAERMAQALERNASRDLWQEVSHRMGGSTLSTESIDDVEGNEQVCILFRDKYDELYSSVSYDKQGMKQLSIDVDREASLICGMGKSSSTSLYIIGCSESREEVKGRKI
ncbi:hypothetical protein CAPTEDRAFT_217482 [Capitella teleta]|uniref:Uncharacterized protein n=1 Tax=Capitella teleta TaxID=283909 RepID=R7UQF8_CAPTE|nr:hypothetical protein CAPTEDRAFT_217482 [Capitella teleta]|eukprot:ELU05636.1 hypothetical protein CAPTEDRAFT_217482 [Capitella teleta]